MVISSNVRPFILWNCLLYFTYKSSWKTIFTSLKSCSNLCVLHPCTLHALNAIIIRDSGEYHRTWTVFDYVRLLFFHCFPYRAYKHSCLTSDKYFITFSAIIYIGQMQGWMLVGSSQFSKILLHIFVIPSLPSIHWYFNI